MHFLSLNSNNAVQEVLERVLERFLREPLKQEVLA